MSKGINQNALKHYKKKKTWLLSSIKELQRDLRETNMQIATINYQNDERNQKNV